MKVVIEQMLDRARAEGIAATLSRQLRRRFAQDLPPPLQARLAGASVAELDTWADRVIDAPSLEAVFKGGN